MGEGVSEVTASAVPSSACGPLAQLARALASHARGHWFESSTVHLFIALTCGFVRRQCSSEWL